MTPNIAHSDISDKPQSRYNRLTVQRRVSYTENMQTRLKEIRKTKQLTQRQVAEKAGLSLSYYTEIEGGKKQLNARRLEAIARALSVSPHEIIVDESDPGIAELIEIIGDLSHDQQKLVMDMARSLAKAGSQTR